MIVDGDGGRVVAAAEAGNIADLHILGRHIGEAALKIGAQFAGAVEIGNSCPHRREFALGGGMR